MPHNIKTNLDFLLVDNVQKLSHLGDYQSKQIITFDYDSHVFLNKQKIPHIISDKFHTDEELHDIENLIHSFVKWYEIPSLKNILLVNDINLGELFYLEFRDELVSFLKKFVEISNFIRINPNCHYFVSENIWEIISTLSNDVTKINIKNQFIKIYDSIDVPLKLGSKQFTITLSAKNASKIQNLFNKIYQIFFSYKKINNKFPTILLINFSTIKNEKFLSESKNHDLNIVKYDRTTPSIWNKHTFDIVKNSKCILENEITLLDKRSMEKIKLNITKFLSKIDFILSSEELEKFFSLKQINFGNEIKPLLKRLCEKRFVQAAKEIELTKNLLKKHSFSKILLYNESLMIEQIILKLAQKQKIPVYVLQHGMFYDSKEMISENYFQQTLPEKTDYYLSWGKFTTDFIQNYKKNFNKLINIGCLFFDKAFQNSIPSYSDSGYVLLVCDPLAFNRPIDLSISQKKLYEDTIEQVCKIFLQLNKKIIIKPHPQKNQNEQEIINKIDPTIKIILSGDVQPLIKSADLVISIDVTTVILEAMIMEKPIISIRMKEHYGVPEIFNYCEQININSLDSWLKSFYNDPNLKNDLIIQGNKFIQMYFANPGNASKSLLNYLEEF